mgnify:CR=1 FL=1
MEKYYSNELETLLKAAIRLADPNKVEIEDLILAIVKYYSDSDDGDVLDYPELRRNAMNDQVRLEVVSRSAALRATRMISRSLSPGKGPSDEMKKVIKAAIERVGRRAITTKDLVEAVLHGKYGIPGQVMEILVSGRTDGESPIGSSSMDLGGKDPKEMAESFWERFCEATGIPSEDPGTRETSQSNESEPAMAGPALPEGSKGSPAVVLRRYGRNMTDEAKSGKYDPVLGRDKEIDDLIRILSCRKKNNAMLLGDPGAGKTSIVEGLAQRIADGNVPAALLGKEIYELNLTSLVSGTKYRGDYEERLQGVIEEVTSSQGRIIVYIDEFHGIIGNGDSSGGTGDGANILKPYLARGEFQCIGSTTDREYQKHVAPDGAMKRRFQNIQVQAPGPDETRTILQNLTGAYEKFHGVRYTPEAVAECVRLAERYLTDRCFPDKAIDLLDLSGAAARLAAFPGPGEKYQELRGQIEEVKAKKLEAVTRQDFIGAAEFRETEVALKSDLDSLLTSVPSPDAVTPEVTPGDVVRVVSELLGVPASRISGTDLDRLRDLSRTLGEVVVGQDMAVKETVRVLQRSALGLRDPGRPMAALMMVGPTGSGKTWICKKIATEYFGTPDALIRFDMSEFSQPHQVTKLLGSTASYVGYGDEPMLGRVRKRPSCVVLFDEIEKASPEIYPVFLNILDEGMVTLGDGSTVNFRESVVVFTGNIGDLGYRSAGFTGGTALETGQAEGVVKDALKKKFTPEFLNRISKVIVFKQLDESALTRICLTEIQRVSGSLDSQGWTLTVDMEVVYRIVRESDQAFGAREIQRGVIREIEEPVADLLLEYTGTSREVQVGPGGPVILESTPKKTRKSNARKKTEKEMA